MVAGEAVRVEAIEVVAAQLAIRLAVAEHVIRDHEDAVGDRDDGLLVAAPPDEPAVLRCEAAVPCADGAAGALDERRAASGWRRGCGRSYAPDEPLVPWGFEEGPKVQGHGVDLE